MHSENRCTKASENKSKAALEHAALAITPT